MAILNIQSAIIEFGTEAVLRYRTISHAESDSALPEIFLGGLIASRLYDRIRCPIHIERPYTTMAAELGIMKTPELINEMGLQRADLAVYQAGVPSHIVEFKIFDEGTKPAAIAFDLTKAKKLANLKSISAVLGVMICETSGAPLKSRIERLQGELGSALICGEPQQSVDRRWNWCFGCYCWGKAKVDSESLKFQ